MTTSEKILGTPAAGFGNTVPMMGSNGKYGVWNVLENNWAANTPWDLDQNKVIELYDDMVMSKKSLKVRSSAAKKNGKKIVRERGGEKATIVAEVLAKNPGRSVPRLIIFCAARAPEVSDANWRYLITKVLKAAA